MAFFCAGSSVGAKKKVASSGPKPAPPPTTAKGAVVTSNGRVINTAQEQPLSTTIPHSNSVDLPNSRKMIVLQEYKPNDNRGLPVKRGESVQVKSADGSWLFVRNEWGKEGFVPSSHLVAPYSTTRSRKSNPIRPVMSGSNIHDMEPSPKIVPMHHSTSAGRPRQPMIEQHGDENRRIISPNSQNGHDLSNNNNNTLSQMSATTYEQKYSPSSSSGVASLNGPSSPSFQSQTEQHSSGSSLDHTAHHHHHHRCSPHEQCSLSSLDDGTHNYTSCENDSVMANGHHSSGGEDDEDSILRNGSDTHMQQQQQHLKAKALPRTPTNAEGMQVADQQHIYSTIVSSPSSPPPPPVPPRPPKGFSASQGDYFESTTTTTGNDTYSSPVDAVAVQPNGQDRHFNYPRVRSLNDVRFREIRKEQQQQQQNDLYTPVYQGKGKPHSKQNGMTSYGDSSSSHSEGGSGSSSRRSSGKRSGSRHRMRNDRATPMEEHYPPQMPECQLNHDEKLPMLMSQTRISKFRKCLWGLFVVTEDFTAFDENDVSVMKGEHVSVWNQDDQEWYWVVKHTSNSSEEGFVPGSLLREIVTQQETAGQAVAVPEPAQKQHVGGVHHKPLPPQVLGDFRHRVASMEPRGGGGGGGGVHRRPSFGSSGGGSSGIRGRLNSDSSASLRLKSPSNASIEKTGVVENSPPSSPPPPYTEYDSSGRRHFSMSQQQAETNQGSNYTTRMHRTRSQGHVSSYRTRPRGNTPTQLSIPPSGGGGGGGTGDHMTRRRGGGWNERITPPAEQFPPPSPAMVDGGTLV